MYKTSLLSVSPNLHNFYICDLLGDKVNQNSRYPQLAKQYIDTVLQSGDGNRAATNTQPRLLTLGQLGFGDGHEIILLLAALQATNLQNPLKKHQTRVHISVFEHCPINRKQLELQWQQQGLLHSDHHLFDFAQALLNCEIAAIEGCQRLSLLQNTFIIDLYQGSPIAQAKTIATPNQQRIAHWFALPHTSQVSYSDHYFSQHLLWQYGRISADNATFLAASSNDDDVTPTIKKQLALCGFLHTTSSQSTDDIAIAERNALRQQIRQQFAYNPMPSLDSNDQTPIAIIGGGIASASLALSLAERGKDVVIYCKDDTLGQGASGNKQGAIYPLLTPENDSLSQFFQQAFLYSRRRIQALIDDGYYIGHDWCGVLHTGFDLRSQTRLDKIIHGQAWPSEIAFAVNPIQATQLAKVDINKSGFYYPLGGWACPFELAQASIAKAQTLTKVRILYNSDIHSLESHSSGWQLFSAENKHIATHDQVIIASGEQLTRYKQTKNLQITGFRGQVSHVPSQGELAQLNTVICANGYLTPQHNQLHCVGASYVKNPQHLDFCPLEQHENSLKMQQSFPNSNWPHDINVSNNDARIGVRMVSRDHFPVMGCAPDVEELFARYAVQKLSKDKPSQWQRYWQTTPAPIYDGLYVLGGLGSRGLSSGPLVAECLAANLCGELSPLSSDLQARLSPNRMWLRKLLKGKALM
ncbi:FAD-dependent 5-carboxymethylaminomethyl-2-thiouridine(34) oxidoreductase MnmC [Shewanella sp. CAL98-MNA-CIBAN-0140]|uniref:FAD-dependent 5-carboxymethylaminomethyl-2-thiouridine(34) oxidoreductase MnmC n=1 Tax=unclassified Shewanella TaxID=196818 RepID=UPI0033167BE0